MEVVPPFSGLSGTFEVKPVANDEGWHFCSDGATFKGDATKWGRGGDQQPGPGITSGCVFLS